MTATTRNFNRSTDFLAISDFLYTLYQPDNRDGNWFQPIWEYAYTHGMFDGDSVERLGIWEDDGAIVGVVLYESILGEAFFNIHPDYEHLKPEMLEYAEQHLTGKTEDGKRYLKAYVTDFDTAFESVVQSKGYEIEPRSHRPMSQFVITDPFPPIRLLEGFKLKSLVIHKPGYYNGRHFTTYITDAKQLQKAGKLNESEKLLLELIAATEEESATEGLGVAPWYYEELAKIYRRKKEYSKEINILERFAKQRHAPGVKPPRLLERLNKVKELAATQSNTSD